MYVAGLQHRPVDAAQEAQKLLRPLSWFASKPLPGSGWRGRHSPAARQGIAARDVPRGMTTPDLTSSAANSVVVPPALVIVGHHAKGMFST